VQRVTDGHKSVIGHHSQEEVIYYCKKQRELYLGDAAHIAYDLALCQDIHQHLWASGKGIKDVHQGHAREEEVHRCVQVGV
jgi:hypothetical protein